MTYDEFIEWLSTCPSHKWEHFHEEPGHVVISFPIQEDES
jgi:hypothetical protein